MLFKEFKQTETYKSFNCIEICINAEEIVNDGPELDELTVAGAGIMQKGTLLVDLVR